ncbi:hypothetical protein ZIOFF_006718 [Zingiber officinale]|uniref:DYW domain-containing protein n=1 Tax=Zingiber officinale TaxID=94328 RepID=A0A8J5ICC8_ZINOF|nr:hypothetical protein ZIOFF_006718 [Zingiber officinale]
MTVIRSLLSPAGYSPPPVRRNARPEAGELRGLSSLSYLVLDRTRRGELPQALELFLQLQRSGWSADEFALASLLKSCSALPGVRRLGEQLHAKSVRAGLSSERGVRTSLVAMYSAAGRLVDARQVFDEVPMIEEADVPTWNAVISAYAFHGSFLDCFLLFRAMLELAHLVPTDATFAILISACVASQRVAIGKVIHAMALKNQSLDATKTLNSLISMYAKLGFWGDAMKVFDAMCPKDVVSWNAIISGLVQNGEFEAAISLFRRMSVSPNRITCLSLLSAIASVPSLRLGKEVHAWLIRSGLNSETAIGNSLIAMYGKCSEDVQKGRLIFEMLPCPDVISWNSMLSGYAQNGEFISFYKVFEEMQSSGSSPDLHTLTILLCALSPDSLVSCKLGREIHGYLLRREAELPVSLSVYNALLTMYSNFGRICDAEKVFKGLNELDSFTFNSMIDGLSNNDLCHDAMALFVEMHRQGFPLESSTLSIVLTVCSKMVSVELGKQLHAFAVKQCLHASIVSQSGSLSVDNALVSMYSKCGSLNDAIRVFQRMEKRDVVSWTAMITGCAQHGAANGSFEFFGEMRNSGIYPNSITYLGLLTACAHAGLVEEGKQYFGLLIKECKCQPSIEHYACMVDLFGRSGQFQQSEAMVQLATSRMKQNSESCLRLWKVLLGACHSHRQLDLGISIGSRILDSNPDDETTHVLLSNLYAAFGLWHDAISIRRLMKEKGLKKEAGCSWVETGNRKHVFVAADDFHENRKEIYEKLDELDNKCRRIGYVPATKYVLHDVDKLQKEAILRNHSERLAVSFALLSSAKTKGVVRVIKNLRVCEDCHNWMKFACEVEGVEIVLRDSRRYSQLSCNSKTTSAGRIPALSAGQARGGGNAKLAEEDKKVESTPKEREMTKSEVLNAFSTRFVRLNGILFTLETFEEVFSSLIKDLNVLLSCGPEENLNFGPDAIETASVSLRLIAILIFTNAFIFAFAFAGDVFKLCLDLQDAASSCLLPSILFFIEWLACHPDVSAASDAGEKTSSCKIVLLEPMC